MVAPGPQAFLVVLVLVPLRSSDRNQNQDPRALLVVLVLVLTPLRCSERKSPAESSCWGPAVDTEEQDKIRAGGGRRKEEELFTLLLLPLPVLSLLAEDTLHLLTALASPGGAPPSAPAP